nr:A24 family peptidase [Desulfitobacterium hafniense]
MLTGFLYFLFVILTFLLAVTDYFIMRLPDKLTFPLLGIGLLFSGLKGSQVLFDNGVAALFIGGLFALVAYFYPRGMGMGDAKYVTGLALFLGLPSIVFTLALATSAALILGGFLIISKRIKLKQQMPFGPFLTIGAWLTMIVF